MNIRTSKPIKGNKFYTTKQAGGYSTCVEGRPTDVCNVLSNCVGYACGRFNEIIGKMKYPQLNCNAENFIERAISLGLQVVSKPTIGGIMVWQRGATLKAHDGAGHVEAVEKFYDNGDTYNSASNWGGTSFYNVRRSNKNGNWGAGSAYTYRGCIVNPKIGYKPYVAPKPVEPVKPEPKPEPIAPKPTTKLKKGDKVTITGLGNANSYGTGIATGRFTIGWKREVLGVFEGRKNPIRVGNKTGTTGWYKETSLKKR